MKITIFSHVDHTIINNSIYGYGPYIREMNLWIKDVNSVEIVANLTRRNIDKIDLVYKHNNIAFTQLKAFNLTSAKYILKTFVLIPKLLIIIYKAMKRADHIHLRCPGNVGLLACLVQILFPSKIKTAKYAGNWDPKSKQPWSYKFQRWILNNTFLTKNMQVLVYGEWPNMSKNIKPFFTATYSNIDAENSLALKPKFLPKNNVSPIKFMFVGTLSVGKRPLFALQVFNEIVKKIPNCTLDFYGEGIMRYELEQYINQHNLQNKVVLFGNKTKEEVKLAYQEAHFLFLASKSEGWPKVVAEAMFWGCIPLATNVSCVKQMMGDGLRGLVLDVNIVKDANKIIQLINKANTFESMSQNGRLWSTQYTLDKFESEINNLLAIN